MKLLNHIYWQHKTRFALEADLYDNWVAFAVEEGEFQYMLGGDADEREEGRRAGGSAGPGDIVVCPPGVRFARRTVTPLTFHYIQFSEQKPDSCGGPAVSVPDISMRHTPAPVSPQASHTSALPSLNFFGKHRPLDQQRLFADYAYLRFYAEDGREAVRRWKEHLLHDMLELLELENAAQQETQGQGVKDDALMMEAAARIASGAAGPFNLRDLADGLGLSPVQMTRRFRRTYGQTPSEYLKALRLERARMMLRDTEMTLAEIAEAAGYDNGFYLSRVFTRTFGITPSAFRKNHHV
ncbi:hypothetical protein C2I18_05740 [Paenibacillus sp. PK3_47]|uniref:helix-turn-helix transcriptional regulator n=1 Tax=Paenibacillus sp. PK3_47 TaxID=2072642 RepID=UPI00201DA48F|nr:helix-turn-helix transcriptional regulator [Paenibacillus sp. PK3_47]UQZ33104.1 hypothetical protein C2I18_05740 [Paenibacillus sp. PK3_47]